MKQELVSVIVPVYRVAQYLPECIESVLRQTYRNLELILVDDGSPDRCGEICDAYSARDSRVKVIHKPNGGAASARNAGLDAAQGSYICFVDSDDAVSPDYVSQLMERLISARADIAVCGFHWYTKAGMEPCGECEPPGSYGREDYLRQFLKNWTCALLWNKLFRREVIGALRMEEGHRIDDEFFTYQVVLRAEKIVVFDSMLYQYRLRRSSVMQETASGSAGLLMDRIAYLRQRYEHIRAQAPELENAFFADLLDSYARYRSMCAGIPRARAEIRSWTWRNLGRILGSSLGLKEKLIYLNALILRPAGHQPAEDRILSDADTVFE